MVPPSAPSFVWSTSQPQLGSRRAKPGSAHGTLPIAQSEKGESS